MATEGSAASRAGQAGPALLELVHLSNKLVLDNVYLNGLHALRRFEVRNVSAFPLTIKLRSNLGSQIAFQLTNENLPERDLRHPLNRDLSSASLSSSVESGLSDIATDRELQQQRARLTSPVSAEGEDHRWAAANSFNPVTTNTVEAAAVGVFQTEHNTLHGHQFNQLFNYVNHIDELKIAPGESQKIILAFLPDAQGRGRRNADKDDQSVDKEAKLEDVANDDETYDFFEVNGLLFFFAYKSQDASLATALPSDSNGSAINETTREHISSSNDTNGSGSRSRSGTGSKKEGDENVALSTQAPPDHQISVKFRSRVCRSVLWTDIGDTGISFDDCVVGETYFKDFSISNRSEIELFWILNMADLSKKQERPWLKLTDYDTGEPLDGRPIPAYSHRRFRLTFRPRDVGEYSYEFQLENANDSSNTVEAACHAVVRSALREESLVVSSGNVVDFGDCLTGLWAKQRLVLRNISEKSLDIAFGSEAQGVVFQLKSDEQGYESAAKGVSIGGDIGNPANDQTKDDPFTRATENSEISFSQSAASSRPGSPSVLGWKHGEAANRGSSSTDLAAMISAAAGFSHADEDGDSEGSGEGDYVQGDGVGHSGEEYRRIEELQLRPGTERVVEVCYRPAKDAPSPDHRGGRLVRRNFRLLLSYSYHGTLAKERKAIQCKARTCTSFIDVNPKIVNFGDTDVGTLKSAPILITNCSDLPARVELRFVSKVLNTFRDEILIPPKQSTEAKVDIYPRKVNPEYRKQLTVVNVLNRENDQHVEVRSTNVDQNRVTFHSLFYRILTPTSSNFVDFGEVILNSTVARSLTIANISKKRLVLQITSSSPDEIKIYGRGAPNSPTMEPLAKSTAERRERLLESISDRRKLQRVESAAATAATTAAPTKIAPGAPKMRSMADIFETASADYLDLASTLSVKDGRRSPRRKTVQHQVGALKQLRAQYREATGSGQEEESADIRPSLSARLGLPTKDSLSIGEVPAKPDMDPDSERFSKSLEAALRNVETGTQRSGSKVNEGSESATLSVNTLVSMFDAISGVVPPTFQKASGEERYVRTRLHLNREIESAIKDGRLAPLSQLEIAPESDMPLLLLFMPDGESKPYIQAKARKVDYRVFIRLIEFDRDIEQPQFEQLLRGDQDMIPVRELLLRSSLSRSMMELNQKNINFGVMEKNEHRTKTIVIRNNSEAPLLYAIRKSGSIASGDLILGDGRMGIVRGHGKREVEFMFDPSLAGPFHERLTIENVQDRTNDLSISVKATIRRPAPFMLESDAIDFGPCLIDDTCMTAQTVVVSNTSFKKTRMFEIRADPAELHFKKCTGTFIFDLVDNEDDYVEEAGDMQVDGAPIKRRRPLMMLSKEMEEEIEHLEQKLKIAKRKGHKDKVKKLLDKLHKLRAGIVGDDYNEDSTKSQGSALGAEGLTDTGKGPTGDTTPKASESAFTQLIDPELSSGISSMNPSRRASQVNLGTDAAPADTPSPVVSLLQFKVKRTDHGIVFALEPRTIRTISVRFRPISSDAPAACAMQGGEDAPLVRNGSDSKLNDGPGLRGSEYIASKLITNEAPDAKDCVVHVSGKLYVHEHKNMDITKEVDFSATVHLDPAAFFDQLPQKRDGKRGQSDASPNPEYLPIRDTPETQPDSRSPSPLFISRPVHSGGGKAPAAPLQSPVGASQLFAAPPSSARVVTSPVDAANIPLIEVPIIDLGNVKINERKDCYFTFTNRGSGALPYKLDAGADGLLQGYESFGVLSGGETRRVDMHFVPTTFGRQSCSLSVQSEGNGERTIVTFSFYVVASSYLRFPSLPDPAASTVELDFGYCYVDPKRKFARVLSFPIENVSDDELYISAISNLAQQCYIFTDVETESPAVNLRIAPHSTETVFIALQPYFGGSSARRQVSVKGQTPTSGANTSQTEPSAGGTEDFRTLVGGIKFLVQKKEVSYKEAQQPSTSAGEVELPHIVADELYQLMTYTAKFNAIIGQSLMSVSTTLVDLGTISNLGAVYVDSFFVCNMSSRMPLEFSVKAPDGLELEPYTGRIDAKQRARRRAA
ncbi:uncharacterized protein EV422DRAFT_40284 [Fimicolochytrium jonesii]|uniref:uncharacterized protein n=1 Tax=Fimicolochytrium jonesii TaxID=1396493 RepID=UPI0022FE84D3|nr:uncharacterized protein EV422DRAFT_40284 [Fimicolochytrium jonesii]KAI8821376.1 hypothetical protein EV422DRAFT_40284 [Fimicolochytrium jonesii]